MKQVVWTGVNQLELRDDGRTGPLSCLPGEVCLRVTAAGVCSTDVHLVDGSMSLVPPPRVLGHEFGGVVEHCGARVKRFHPGDRVKCDSVVGCGECEFCRRGAAQHCPAGFEFGMSRDGGWSEWIVAPEGNLHPLPASISDQAAAILDVEVINALRMARIARGETVLIFGAGPGGLIALQTARLFGAARVIVCGLPGPRLDLARALEADSVLDVTRDNPVTAVDEITRGAGVDVVFEAAGSSTTLRQAVEVLRPQGRLVLYGLHHRPCPEVPINTVILKQLTLHGALSDRSGWAELLEWAAAGRIDFEALISHQFRLEQAPEAVRLLTANPEAVVKAVLVMPRN